MRPDRLHAPIENPSAQTGRDRFVNGLNFRLPLARNLPGSAETTPAMISKISTTDWLSAEERRELPDSAFGIPETREFPLVDAVHVRAAEAYFRYAPDNRKAALARRILARAEEFGVDIRSRVVRGWAGEA